MNLLQEYQRLQHKNKDLSINYDPYHDLYTIKYLHTGIDWNNYLYRLARGLVLDKYGNIVIHPYDKFFNLGQLQSNIYSNLDESIRNLSKWDSNKKIVNISEKIDGTLVTLKEYKGDTLVATTGNTNPDTAMVAKITEFLNNNINIKVAIVNECELNDEYIFEFYDPKNQYAYSYGYKSKLFLHGIRDAVTHQLLNYNQIKDVYYTTFKDRHMPVELVKDYSMYSEQDLLAMAKTASNMEGWVITFDDGQMLKLKTDEYLKLRNSVDLLFGTIKTVSKTRLIIDKYFDNSLDDIISMLGLSVAREKRSDSQIYIKSILKLFARWLKIITEEYPSIYITAHNVQKKEKFFRSGGFKKDKQFKMLLFDTATNGLAKPNLAPKDILAITWKTKIRNKRSKIQWILKEANNIE